MPDTEYRQLIQAASDKALLGYQAVVQRAIQDADKNAVERLMEAKSSLDQSALSALRHFLRQEGTVILRRADALYRTYLDRAMQTMYIDLRGDMRKLTANELSLIDDEVINQQIEVGRLAHRMREANEEGVGRLNVIIANLHGEVEARERENPFRPYLLARALFESIHETVEDDSKEKDLFEYLANALIPHLTGFYTAILDVFEVSGVRGKFIAQQSRAAHHQRYFGAPQFERRRDAPAGASVMAGLTRVLETLQKDNEATAVAQPASVEEFIRSMFRADRGARDGKAPVLPGAASPLIAQITEYQKKAAHRKSVDEQIALVKDQQSELRTHVDLDKASAMERMTVDVVGMLFEFVLEDEQIPLALRQYIGRLQIPMLKAALLEPHLMRDEKHPARRLLNRMSSAAIGADVLNASGQKLAAEMERVTRTLLEEFDSDTSVFSKCLHEFDHFLGDSIRRDDSLTTQAIEAIESAEKYSILLTNTTQALCDVLLPLNIDKAISDFIITVWPHVLVEAAWRDVETSAGLFEQYHAVVPELIWSIQEKVDAKERAVLMRLLPDLVRRLRSALSMIQLPDDESKPVLDLLVGMHTRILRGSAKPNLQGSPTLDDLRREFARLAIQWSRVSWGKNEPPQVRESVVEDVFTRKAVKAELHLDVGMKASTADLEFLSQTYLLGTRVEIHSANGANTPAQLTWISTHRSLYLFRRDELPSKASSFVVYSSASLLEALGDQSIVPLEYAPVFERAVESLLFGAGKIDVPI